MIGTVLNRLPFRLGRRSGTAMPAVDALTVPAATPAYAVGDIHGQIGQLRQALAWIIAQAQAQAVQGLTPQVVFLGDYVDRGDDSRAVLEELTDLEATHPGIDWIFLAGNHEAALLGFLDDPLAHAPWLEFGGVATLLSYGIHPPAEAGARALHQVRDQLAQALPSTHLAFLKRLRPHHQLGDYVFVHAGLRPGFAWKRQSVEDMLWIRDEFLATPHWYGKCVVHGHTIEAEPTLQPWRIGIDSGAYDGGPLSCLVLTGNRREIIAFPP